VISPIYAILSHTWGDDEVSHEDVKRSAAKSRKGYAKILGCCQQAILDGIEWVWVDMCCIDKTSSTGLSEAIKFHVRLVSTH